MNGRFTNVLNAALLAAALCMTPQVSSATSLSANTEYHLSGSFKLYFHGLNGAPSYAFEGTYAPGASLNIKDVSNGTILGANTQGTIDFTIRSYDETSGQLGATLGSASGSLFAGWSGLDYDSSTDVAAGLKGAASGGAFVLDLDGSIANQKFDFSSALSQAFASVALGGVNGVYDNMINSVGDPSSINQFSIALGDTGAGVTDALFAWFYSADTVFLGQHFAINGDLNNRYSDCNTVPEPATVALLGMAMLGVAAHQRRKLLA